MTCKNCRSFKTDPFSGSVKCLREKAAGTWRKGKFIRKKAAVSADESSSEEESSDDEDDSSSQTCNIDLLFGLQAKIDTFLQYQSKNSFDNFYPILIMI